MMASVAASKKGAEPDWRRVRIVVVDQDVEFGVWIKSIFRKRHIKEVLTAARPDAAFDYYLHNSEVDIALVAFSYSTELLMKLRDTTSSPCPDLPVLVLTENDEKVSAGKASALGIDGTIAKPISEDAFIAKVTAALLKPRQSAPSPAEATPEPPPPPKAPPEPKEAAPPVPREAPKPKPEPKAAPKPVAKEVPKTQEPRQKARETSEPPPPTPESKPDQSLADDLPPPKPKKAKTKHSPHDWAAEMAQKKNKKVRRNTSSINVDEVVKQHGIWLKTRGKQGKRASLAKADLSCCYMEGVDLSNADLQGADLSDANLSKANLNGADLRRAKLGGALLNDTNLGVSKLRHVDFNVCHLHDTNLRGADLSGASFSGADVNEADFTGAIFLDTDITNVDLSHAEGLTQKQIDRTRGNMNTKLPSGLRRKLVEIEQ